MTCDRGLKVALSPLSSKSPRVAVILMSGEGLGQKQQGQRQVSGPHMGRGCEGDEWQVPRAAFASIAILFEARLVTLRQSLCRRKAVAFSDGPQAL